MASHKFYIRSKTDNATVYSRFIVNRNKYIRLPTKETVNPLYWNGNKGQVKDLTSENISISAGAKKHHDETDSRLRKLETFIIEQYKKNPENVDKEWLTNVIDAFYNGGKEQKELDFLIPYLYYYKENVLPFRTYNRKRIGKRTIQLYKNIINLLIDFIKTKNRKYKVSDYGKVLSNQFEKYLFDTVKLNENTIGRYLPAVKTVLKDAKDLGIEINSQLEDIKGFSVETATVYLKPSELKRIKELKVLTEYLQITRDWLIIGCHTGQRASDLFRMNKEMIQIEDGRKFLYIKQTKTKKKVKIPLHDEVLSILDKRNGNFPPTYSSNIGSSTTIFNRALKTLAKIAEINRTDKGRIYNRETKQYDFGEYPIHEIISSHICRRSFCTNNFEKGLPVQIIMSISGHKTESEFLKYINKDNSELSKQIFLYWEKWENETHENLKKPEYHNL